MDAFLRFMRGSPAEIAAHDRSGRGGCVRYLPGEGGDETAEGSSWSSSRRAGGLTASGGPRGERGPRGELGLAVALSLDVAAGPPETARLPGITRLGRKVGERVRAGADLVCARGTSSREGGRVGGKADGAGGKAGEAGRTGRR